MTAVRRFCLVFLLLLLAGCKTELFTKQTETDANEIVSALLENHIDGEKRSPDDGKTWDVVVEKEDIVRALAVLREEGLPHEKRVDLGDMFKKEGLISTPTEERVRFIYGVSQELETTLSQIDGVVVARVHIVLPNNDPLATTVKPSSASVFIKYRWEADLSTLTPAIKNLVSRSVEGLSYDNVSVTLVPGTSEPPPPSTGSAGGHTWLWVLLALLPFAALAGAIGVCWWRPQWMPALIARRFAREESSAAGGGA